MSPFARCRVSLTRKTVQHTLSNHGVTMDQELVQYLDSRFQSVNRQFQELRDEMTEGLQGLRGETSEGLQGLRGEMTAGLEEVKRTPACWWKASGTSFNSWPKASPCTSKFSTCRNGNTTTGSIRRPARSSDQSMTSSGSNTTTSASVSRTSNRRDRTRAERHGRQTIRPAGLSGIREGAAGKAQGACAIGRACDASNPDRLPLRGLRHTTPAPDRFARPVSQVQVRTPFLPAVRPLRSRPAF